MPEGLTFSDLGAGKGAIEGVPEQATSASIRVVATGIATTGTAQMSAALVVADKPASPPAPVVKLETPSPALSQKPPPAPVALEPAAPPQSAATQVSKPAPSAPTAQGAVPASVAQNEAPATHSSAPAPQTVARVEAPSPQSSFSNPGDKALPVAPVSTAEKAKAFVASFDGERVFPHPAACRGRPARTNTRRSAEQSNRSVASIQRTNARSASRRNSPWRRSPQSNAPPSISSVSPRRTGGGPARLALKNYEVGSRQPLSGTISNLEGRRLYLVLVDNDGVAHRLDAKVDANGDSATFDIPLTADASSVGPMQMLLAIVSDKPIPTLDETSLGQTGVDRVPPD